MTTTRGPEVVDGVLTNWIPFTTPGNPAALLECSQALYYMPGEASYILAFDPYYGHWINTAIKCLAAEHTAWWDQHSDSQTTSINLGPFNCPAGYTTVDTSVVNSQTTAVGCCPLGYSYQGTLLPAPSAGQCASDVSIGSALTALTESLDADLVWSATTATITSPFQVIGIHINGFIFREESSTSSPISPASALVTTTSSSSTTSLSGIGSSSSTDVPSSNPTTPLRIPSSAALPVNTGPALADTASKGKSGLSSGATIGVSIAAAFLVVAISALIAAYFFLKRRRAKKMLRAELPADNNQPHSYERYEPYDPQLLLSPQSMPLPQSSPVPLVEAPNHHEKYPLTGPVEMWAQPSYGR